MIYDPTLAKLYFADNWQIGGYRDKVCCRYRLKQITLKSTDKNVKWGIVEVLKGNVINFGGGRKQWITGVLWTPSVLLEMCYLFLILFFGFK